MTRTIRWCTGVLSLVATLSLVAVAQDKASTPVSADQGPVAQRPPETKKVILPKELQFDQAMMARVQGRLVGRDQHQYTFDARKGQKVVLALSSDLSPWIGMDLLAPVFAPTLKNAPAVYTNFIDGTTRWEGIVPGNGTYTVRLGLLNAQARKTGRVDYELDVNIK